MIRLKSVHEPMEEDGAARYLIDWKWPARKHHRALRLTGWPRQLLPDAGLWNWFHHAPLARLTAFRWRYFRQLDQNAKYWAPIAHASESEGGVVLLSDAKKVRVVPAQFLKEFLELQIKSRRVPKPVKSKRVSSQREGVAPPVDKAISRKRGLPLKPEMSFMQEQKRTRGIS